MSKQRQTGAWRRCVVWGGLVIVWTLVAGGDPGDVSTSRGDAKEIAEAKLRAELKTAGNRIVHECRRDERWEIHVMAADGSGPVSLTPASGSSDLYPHASPDGTRICFVVDDGEGKTKSRDLYYMNADGSGRTLVARNARDPCWGPDSNTIAYTKGEYERYTTADYASKGVFYYDLKSRKHRQHPNQELLHLYALCWSPDGKWLLATVHGGMGYKHALLAIEAEGNGVYQLEGIDGCRPDISPDGRKLLWHRSDQAIGLADLDLTLSPPKVTNARSVITCDKEHKVYHADWSPDGKHLAFSHGPVKGAEQVGALARGWNICVADARKINVWIALTSDGANNKEPDWLPVADRKR